MLAGACAAETIRVAAAISLKDAVTECAAEFKAATGDEVAFVFGSSGQLAGQIASGADVDLFISAADKQVNDLIEKDLLDPATRAVVASNKLVLIAQTGDKQSPARFEDLAGVERLAIGEPKTVPAGMYAKQVLDHLKLSDSLAGRLIYGANVRQVLDYVERGEVPVGIVYASDALATKDKVRVLAIADDSWHEPIVYPAAVVVGSKKTQIAIQFLKHLTGDEGQAIFVRYGLTASPAPATQPAR